MEPHNLQVASDYINNVLLARGLLRSGKPIDFAHPESEDGGAEATMARVINMINDLVLRRDVCDDSLSTAESDQDAARSRATGKPGDNDPVTTVKRITPDSRNCM